MYLRRQEYLKGELEKKLWLEINELYTSEESDNSDRNGFMLHPLPWRSPHKFVVLIAIDCN